MSGGIVLVFAGIVLLLRNFGFLPADIWGHLWRLWPLLVVALGLEILLGRRGGKLATVLLMVMMLAAVGYFFWAPAARPSEWGKGARVEHSELLRGLTEARVEIDLSAGVLNLGSLPDDSPSFYRMVTYGHAPSIAFTGGEPGPAGPGQLVIGATRGRRRVTLGTSLLDRWELELSRGLPLSLDITSAAGRGEIDLRHLDVYELNLVLNASHSSLSLPARNGISIVRVTANASNAEIVIPHDVAARIVVSPQASSVRVDGAWSRQGQVYTSFNFDTSPQKLEIRIDANASRVHIRLAGATP
ncbi:MAG: hypothetical protein KGZ50_00940 [Peptococcaceae bacterium]|nr:hypothetical protein [Peptococcaceae bacterium]